VPHIIKEYQIKARDFVHAGEGSIGIKNILKSLGINPMLFDGPLCAPMNLR
jgi:hypothetical protein